MAALSSAGILYPCFAIVLVAYLKSFVTSFSTFTNGGILISSPSFVVSILRREGVPSTLVKESTMKYCCSWMKHCLSFLTDFMVGSLCCSRSSIYSRADIYLFFCMRSFFWKKRISWLYVNESFFPIFLTKFSTVSCVEIRKVSSTWKFSFLTFLGAVIS